MSGIDELRTAVSALNYCREDFLTDARFDGKREEPGFTAEELVKLWRSWRASEWDVYPDQWTDRQIREALNGKPPRWKDPDATEPDYS